MKKKIGRFYKKYFIPIKIKRTVFLLGEVILTVYLSITLLYLGPSCNKLDAAFFSFR